MASPTDEVTTNDKSLPLLLSTIAGLSTCIGAAIVFFFKRGKSVSSPVMSFSLALAGSVMVTVSIISIGPECIFKEEELQQGSFVLLRTFELIQRIASFGMGGGLYCFLSWFAFPEPDDILSESLEESFDGDIEMESQTLMKNDVLNGNEMTATKSRMAFSSDLNNRKKSTTTSNFPSDCPKSLKSNIFMRGDDLETQNQKRAWRVALLLFVSLLFHNFPEGLAVAASTISSKKLGVTVMLGIMIHNIPEGIAIAIPCLKARPDQPWLAFCMASVSGLAEPFGAWVALSVLGWGEKDDANLGLGNVLSFVAGIMVTVAFYELFPEGRRHYLKKTNIKRTKSSDEKDSHRADGQEIDKAALRAYNRGLICGFIIMVITELFMEI